jgi:hypothetical protein
VRVLRYVLEVDSAVRRLLPHAEAAPR